MPIIGFKSKDLRRFFEDGESRRIRPDVREKVLMLLDHLDGATALKDLQIAGFHELKGDRKGTYAWTVTGNYRLTFTFKDGEADDIDLEDYH